MGEGKNNWVMSLRDNTKEGIRNFMRQLQHVCARVSKVSKQSDECMIQEVQFPNEEALPDLYRLLLDGTAKDRIDLLYKQTFPALNVSPMYNPCAPPAASIISPCKLK